MESINHICRVINKKKQVGFSSSEISSNSHFNFKDQVNKKVLASLKQDFENRCCNEGFVLPDTLKIVERSGVNFPLESTKLTYVVQCTFQITVCCPLKDALLHCKVVSKNKIGLLCKIDNDLSPLIILVPNDLSQEDDVFKKAMEKIDTGSNVVVKVLGKKFEHFDKKITVVAQLVTQMEE